ncbi:DUF1501 domain-containing protein [Stratiformator vulcanicus]|uniref:Sulfatase n=1 Tax=Stratiformator vulcanicus TaxID=2527980 RepID=A0A517R201_9PLAN|nr:DUF1501 domain-containing protein [Stratiformator vulcanicus]QDT37873.1 hypothetical protein Pan189_22560 [Stratiformator vulcanicus]
MKTACHNFARPISRRDALRTSAAGFGYLALAGMCADAKAKQAAPTGPLAPKSTHFPAKAKRVIFLFMHGGPSQMDLFDPKPELNARHGEKLPFDLPGLIRPDRLGKLFGVKWNFKRRGESGNWVSELMPHLAKQTDKLCFLKGLHTEGEAHGQAVLRYHTGQANFIRPSIGSWMSYGLGTENQNLPSFITIDYPMMHGGVRNYSNVFLPAAHQGTQIRVRGERASIRHLQNDEMSLGEQRDQLGVIQGLSRLHRERVGRDDQLDGVIESFELAYRMQSEAPQVMDLSGESKATRELYGVDEKPTDAFGRQCLMARRLSEAGVRFVQVSSGYHWDHHGSIDKNLPESCAKTDKPVAGLLADLESRGLLDETLVVWGGEFGRTPVAQIDRGNAGRDHNPHGFTIFMAGGGVKPGVSHGQTDDFGYLAVDGKVHIHDLHATIMHLMGINHKELTYRYAGRDFRLTDVYGRVVKDIIA